SDVASLERWASATQGAGEVHVEIDTGMGRAGFDWRDTASWSTVVRDICASTGVRWKGGMTRVQGAASAATSATVAQWERFREALAQLPVDPASLMVHASNSAAAMRFPDFAADAVRPGIYLYGGNPAPGVGGFAPPRAVATVRARIVLIRDVAPGSTVGYGATHVAREWERWGTVAIGYGD